MDTPARQGAKGRSLNQNRYWVYYDCQELNNGLGRRKEKATEKHLYRDISECSVLSN